MLLPPSGVSSVDPEARLQRCSVLWMAAGSVEPGRRPSFSHAKVTQWDKKKVAASLQPLVYLARPAGLEPTTPWFVAFCTHQWVLLINDLRLIAPLSLHSNVH